MLTSLRKGFGRSPSISWKELAGFGAIMEKKIWDNSITCPFSLIDKETEVSAFRKADDETRQSIDEEKASPRS